MRRTTWFLLGALLLCMVSANAATTKHSHNNFGIVIYTENPNQYILGSLKSGGVYETDHKLFTVIEFFPTNTYMEFSESIAFCGDKAAAFENRGVVVVTFSRVQHQRDCFDLYRVDDVVEPKQ